MNKVVIILGCSGMLGYKLFKFLSIQPDINVYGTLRDKKSLKFFNKKEINTIFTDIDAEEIESFTGLFKELNPDFVVNCIGIIKQRNIKNEILTMIPINSLFPHKIREICNFYNTKLIQISTDCVFSGLKGNYKENDIADARDLYGISKKLGELNDNNSLTIRTSIIGEEIQNKKSLLEWFLSQSKTVYGFKKAIFSGLTTLEFSKIIYHIILRNPDLNGLFHISSSKIDKYTLLNKIAKKYKKNIKILESNKYVIDRSLNSSLFQKTVGYIPKDWDNMIDEMYKFDLIRSIS